tara:strand:- start:88 stop:1347 length:1260 start_codon:yes stop_codon:yes gene_type:complete
MSNENKRRRRYWRPTKDTNTYKSKPKPKTKVTSLKVLDDSHIGDIFKMKNINIVFSKGISTSTGRKVYKLLEIAFKKFEDKRILPIIYESVNYIIVVHEDDKENCIKNSGIFKSSKTLGVYKPYYKTIIVHTSMAPNTFVETIIHEISHGIDRQFVTDKARKFFKKTYDCYSILKEVEEEADRLRESLVKLDKNEIFFKITEDIFNNYCEALKSNDYFKIKKNTEILQTAFPNNARLIQNILKQTEKERWVKIKERLISTLSKDKDINITESHLIQNLFKSLFSSATKKINIFVKKINETGIEEFKVIVKKKYKELKEKYKVDYPIEDLEEKVSNKINLIIELVNFIGDLFPTDYSTTDLSENFAECFLYWVTGDDRLKLFDRYRMQYTLAISKSGGRQIRLDNYLRNYIKLILENKSI